MARPRYHLGETLRHQGKLREAIAVLRQAVELNPDELDAWSALASAYEAEGRRSEAAEAAERAEVLRRLRTLETEGSNVESNHLAREYLFGRLTNRGGD